jgi:hypothetical protein
MRPNHRGACITEGDRRDLAQVVTLLLAAWDLPPEVQVELLGLRPTAKARLADYKAGAPLPAVGETAARASALMAIHQALGLIFRADPDQRYGWVHRPTPLLGGAPTYRTPLGVMLSGLAGIRTVEWIVERLLTCL